MSKSHWLRTRQRKILVLANNECRYERLRFWYAHLLDCFYVCNASNILVLLFVSLLAPTKHSKSKIVCKLSVGAGICSMCGIPFPWLLQTQVALEWSTLHITHYTSRRKSFCLNTHNETYVFAFQPLRLYKRSIFHSIIPFFCSPIDYSVGLFIRTFTHSSCAHGTRR